MRKITFTNTRGESVVLGNAAPLMITKLEGSGSPDSDVQMQKAPYQDGSSYTDTLLDTRSISIEGAIVTQNKADILNRRRELARVFNPKLGKGKLVYEKDGAIHEIYAVVDSAPTFPDKQQEPIQRFLISLICPTPFWLDNYQTIEEMSYLLGGLKFPLSLGTMFSLRGFQKTLVNDGDVSTPVQITFYGPANIPVVHNRTTEEFRRVNQNLAEGEKLIISTEFGDKYVRIVDIDGVETNAFNWIDLESTFWQLQQGDNLIEYGSNDDNSKAKVEIAYQNRYVAV